jgi:hypothetical protein
MLASLKSAVDLALQGQGTRLMQAAEAYKQRTLNEVRQQTISAGVTAALVMTGLAFMLMAVTIGFAALFYWVALWHGTLAGLGAAGGAAMFLSLLMFTVIALRGKNGAPAGSHHGLTPPRSVAVARPGTADFGVAALGQQSVDAATGIVRNGSREAVLATLAATVVIGMLVGRRR